MIGKIHFLMNVCIFAVTFSDFFTKNNEDSKLPLDLDLE